MLNKFHYNLFLFIVAIIVNVVSEYITLTMSVISGFEKVSSWYMNINYKDKETTCQDMHICSGAVSF